VRRINPTADPATGQVEITVSIPNAGGDLVAGLVAQGRVAAESVTGLVVDDDAVDRTATRPTVLRVENGIVARVPVQLGVYDEQGERVQITAGVMAGDTLLIGAARAITPGTPIQVAPIEGPGVAATPGSNNASPPATAPPTTAPPATRPDTSGGG
jgi:multidrug efflux pump subunit AcrA (membrane-fusion protein)